MWRQAQAFVTPPRSVTSVPHNGNLPLSRMGLQINGTNAIMSSVKQSEDGEAIIIRLFNPTARSIVAQVTSPIEIHTVYETDLHEQINQHIPTQNNRTINVKLLPKKIVTLKIIFDKLN